MDLHDGWAGSRASTYNFDCTGPTSSGCWGHRKQLLGQYSGTNCTTCVAGAGISPARDWYSMLIVRPTEVPPLAFSWNKNVLPYLPVGYEQVPS